MSQSITAKSNCPDTNIGVESSIAPAGCIFDPDTGDIIGKVFLCKKQEDIVGGLIEYEMVAFFTDGSPSISPYTGPWSDCNDCPVDTTPPGFTT